MAVPAAVAATPPDAAVKGCDVLVTTPADHSCLLPWPNDAFTKKASTLTGRQLNIPATGTPANTSGKHIDPTYQNLNSGFSPGSQIVIHVPNLSFDNSGIANSQNIDSSLASNAPVVLWDATAKKKVPYFADRKSTRLNSSH